MDTQTTYRKALKPLQEREVAEDWKRPRNERDGRAQAMCCRDFETKERESEGRDFVLGTLLKLLVKDKLLHSGKVPVNVELMRNEFSNTALKF